MINITNRKKIDLYDKKITIIGMGLSGMGAAKLANYLGAKVFVSDSSKKNVILHNSMELLSMYHIASETGLHTNRIFDADLWIVSPGIPKSKEIIQKAKKYKIPIVGEIEFASWFTESKIIAVTGSNGKTTTASIIFEMLKNNKINPVLGGNIGIPFSDRVLEEIKKPDMKYVYVLECSSFQMEFIKHFKPYIALYTNITEDHLDRHNTMKEYIKMKMKMCNNIKQNDDGYSVDNNIIIYNADDPILKDCFIKKSKNHQLFSLKKDTTLFYLKNEKIYSPSGNILFAIKKLKTPGNHNLYNFLAAATCSHLMGISENHIKNVMEKFRGIEHRIEYVKTINKVKFYNDSKSTNIQSVSVAIKSFKNPIILILGGYNKGTDFQLLLPHIKSSPVKEIISYGEAGGHINTALGDAVRSFQVDDLNSAVKKAHLKASPGDIVLLSPGCASFDQFPNYEARGDFFKKVVTTLVPL